MSSPTKETYYQDEDQTVWCQDCATGNIRKMMDEIVNFFIPNLSCKCGKKIPMVELT